VAVPPVCFDLLEQSPGSFTVSSALVPVLLMLPRCTCCTTVSSCSGSCSPFCVGAEILSSLSCGLNHPTEPRIRLGFQNKQAGQGSYGQEIVLYALAKPSPGL
jgi:hypothetical protein